MSNAYREVHALQREREGRRGRGLLPVIAAAIAVPFARPVLLSFLDIGRIGPGTEAIALRLGLVVAGAMALHTYADLVRGPDRAVLDPHPVQPRALLAAIALRTARERATWLAIALAFVAVNLPMRWLLAALDPDWRLLRSLVPAVPLLGVLGLLYLSLVQHRELRSRARSVPT